MMLNSCYNVYWKLNLKSGMLFVNAQNTAKLINRCDRGIKHWDVLLKEINQMHAGNSNYTFVSPSHQLLPHFLSVTATHQEFIPFLKAYKQKHNCDSSYTKQLVNLQAHKCRHSKKQSMQSVC